MIRIHANSLPATRSAAGTNQVTAITHQQGSLVWHPSAPDGASGWMFHQNGREEPLTLMREVHARLEDVLRLSAEDPTGLLHLTLVDDQLFVVPQHHWPVLQVVDQ